jgi:hypothetical protein
VGKELENLQFESATKIEQMIQKLDENCKVAYGDDYLKKHVNRMRHVTIKA